MYLIDTVIVGAGQAGLAASRHLTERGHDHVVVERGHLGQRWTTEVWDSLRLLTPNWMNELPGWAYRGPDPHGFMTAGEFAGYLAAYARSFDAPVAENTSVERVRRRGDGFEVVTDRMTFGASNVVIATGWCDRPAVPAAADHLAPDVDQIVPNAYRNPAMLADGGVLVVGASSTGVQLADELRAAGRDVTLAVGNHSRLPRQYRGMDIFWWLDRIGALDKTIDHMADTDRARYEPSLQLVGRPDRRSIDLATLRDAGVHLVGRVSAIDGHRVAIADTLPATVTVADNRMRRVLAEIDDHIEQHGLASEVFDPEPIPPVVVGGDVDTVNLRANGIRSVIWATGHRRSYPWLHIPVLDTSGEIRQRRGVTPVPGLYVLGQRFQHHRRSNFIGGVGTDAAVVAHHIATHRSSIVNAH
jgi:putative flavoprotein involved in K+ transport